jgi:hypothetical protein
MRTEGENRAPTRCQEKARLLHPINIDRQQQYPTAAYERRCLAGGEGRSGATLGATTCDWSFAGGGSLRHYAFFLQSLVRSTYLLQN